jgi:DNA polymerase I-like protein with 3'-5' exonuclease and polymerase domains
MPLIAAHELDTDCGSIQVYNAMDSMLTCEVLNELKTLLPSHNSPIELQGPKLIYDFERALQAPAIEMNLRGWKIDPWAREDGIAKLRKRLERLSDIIDCYVSAICDLRSPTKATNDHPKPKTLNPNSTSQLATFFYDILQIPPIIRKKEGKLTKPMEREILEKLEGYFIARPIIAAILSYRDNEGQLEVLETEIDSDWRMRTSFNPAMTTTSRFSSSKSITGTGRNFQNIEEELRYMFIANKDKKLFGADLEQAETRETGWLCWVLFGDSSYLDSAESGDPHTILAREIWENDLDWNGDLKHDRKIADQLYYRQHSYREVAKRVRHGTEKFGGYLEIARQIRVPNKLIKSAQERMFATYPCLNQFFTWVAGQLQREHYLIDAFGGRRDFFGRADSNDTIKEGIAFMSQAPTARRLNLGLWRMWKYMGPNSNHPVELIAQLHDAVYGQRLEFDTNEAKIISEMQKHLDVPLSYRGRRFTVPSEAKVGWSWGNANQDHPDGLIKWTTSGDKRTRVNNNLELVA